MPEIIGNGQEAQVAPVEAPASKKTINRRGVATARGTSRLKFSHENAKPNGLFIAHLESVEVSKILIGEETTGLPSFNGLEIPKIVFTFASNEDDANKRKYVTLQFNAVESNVETIPGGKEAWKVDIVFDWIKHILNVFVFNGREMTDDEADALNLDFNDFDENGEYINVPVETVINGWTNFFNNVETILNRGKDGQPYYKDVKGKYIAVWIKLIRNFYNNKTKKWVAANNGNLAFPTYCGEGCIEKFVASTPPVLRINAMTETILPMKIENTAKAPNMPNAISSVGGAAVITGGTPIPDSLSGGFGNIGDIAAEATDMPF